MTIGAAKAQLYYYDGIDNRYNNYEPTPSQYPSYGNSNYQPKESSSSSSLDLKKIKCDNINLNINSGQGANGNSTNVNDDDNNQNKTNHGLKKFDKKDDFAFICVNNNDNEQITPPTPPTVDTETLTVIKNVDCLANSTICAQNPITPSDFNILVEGNNPSQTTFPGSSTGTDVELEPGAYNVTEEGLDTTPHPVCTRLGYEASSSLGNNLFICTNFSDECEGDITIGSPQTCTIDNVLVFCEVTIDTLTGFFGPFFIAYDSENERMYVTNSNNDTVSVIDTTTNNIVGSPITVGGNFPTGIAYDSENERMYVANFFTSSVSVIDTTTNTVIDTDPNLAGVNPIPVGDLPQVIAYDPVNQDMYVTNIGDGTVSVIDTTTNTVIATIPVGDAPFGIAYDPVNHRMYVANFGSNTVSVINLCSNGQLKTLQQGTNDIINTATNNNNEPTIIQNIVEQKEQKFIEEKRIQDSPGLTALEKITKLKSQYVELYQ